MRVLFISTTFPDADTPAKGTYNSALCAALAEEHDVYVVSPRPFPQALKYKLKQKQFQLPTCLSERGITAVYPTFWYTPRFWQEHSGDQMWWSTQKLFGSIIEEFQPDAVLSYWAHPEGEVGVRAARQAGVPSAVIVGGSDVLLLPKIPKRGIRVQDVLLQSDTVITVSEGLRRSVIDLGIHPNRVQTIYQGIDQNVFQQSVSRKQSQQELNWDSDQKHLLWVGRMVPVKALDVLIDGMKQLQESSFPCQVHLVGDGPERARIEKRVQNEGLQQHVSFEGAIGHDAIADYYRAADLTVMTSDSEGLPNVLRESLACGTPFVSTNVGSIQEITDPEYGLLVPPRDPQQFAHAVEAMLDKYAENLAVSFRPRTWSDTASETVELFQRFRKETEELADVPQSLSFTVQM